MGAINLLFRLIGTVLIVLVLSVGIIGTSYSYFTGINTMSSSLLMGDIDVVFSDAQLVPEAASTANTEARIVNNGKNIEISVDNAYPGYSATLNYEITNKGSVPVSCQLIEEGGADIPIKITGDLRYIKGDGGKASGHFTISVEESFDISGGCALNTELNFQQAVVEVR